MIARLARTAARHSGSTTARAVVEAALGLIAARNGVLNAFTYVTAERARARAAAIDTERAAGRPVGPMAGVPFAMKDLLTWPV